MEDAEVDFLLESLQRQLLNYANLIQGAKDEAQKLEIELHLFRAFFRDSTNQRPKEDRFRELVRQIRDAVYQAEDLIDTFVTNSKPLATPLNDINLGVITAQVDHIVAKVGEIYGGKNKREFASLNVRDGGGDGRPEELKAPLVRQDNVVGFEDEVSTLIGHLMNDPTDQLDVISVIGMPGLGKTTLARRIYSDEEIQFEFTTRIWVDVSQELTKKKVYLAILREFTEITEDMYQKYDQELAQMVYAYLEKGKFLIVLDDVQTTQDWEKIRIALPKGNSAGKVLITSRHKEVGDYVNRERSPHWLRFLSQEESWLLLQYEVFGNPTCPPKLEDLGKQIANDCGGLPLAIVVLGGILSKKFARAGNSISATFVAWEKVSHSVSTHLNEDPEWRMEKILALSYSKLPYHLRACFLYLGMFPGGFEIPVWKLIRMWIAEDLIQHHNGISLEETAENYLDELIDRNLVRVDKRRPDGGVKTCRIHDVVRDFCKNEAGSEKENFFQEMKRTYKGFDHPTAIETYRRICIHAHALNFLSTRPFGPRLRSFVCFSKEDTTLPPELTSTIPDAFKLLRVLDVQPIKFEKIPSDMYQLFHLRYIAISFHLAVLPAVFAKLWNIETLIVDTPSPTLEIEADIWKMSQLRHLNTSASASLPEAGNSGKEGGEKLQTLGTISPQCCTEEVFERACNLRELSIRGKLSSLLDSSKTASFNSLVKLGSLEKLKLLNGVFPNGASERKLNDLPPPNKFPPNLKNLTLSATFLDWSHMSILGSLENLRVLKLEDKAFVGTSWKAKDGGFRCLEFLHIGRTDLTFWGASDHHFPVLRHLELHYCEELKEVPMGLADIPNFHVLDMYRCSDTAATSAIRIHEAKQQKWREQDVTDGKFELSISRPPIHA